MIRAENLEKWFGPKQVIDNVSLTVEKGEVLAFLGPNGAGKSTTMRLITGFLPADGGRVTIGGHDIETDTLAAKSIMGYLPENAPAYGEMTVEGFLRFIGSLRGLSGNGMTTAVEAAIETCHLQPVRQQSVETLSKGYLHRTCFAQSILHDPEVLIFDEPTDGLDPNQKHEVRNLIKRMGERKAIIISTHILEEVDAVCSRVVIINEGKLVANGLPDELRGRSKLAGSVLLTVMGKKSDQLRERLAQVPEAAKVHCITEDEMRCQVRVMPRRGGDSTPGSLAAAVFAAGVEAKWDIEEIETDPGRLDEVFREITSAEGGAK